MISLSTSGKNPSETGTKGSWRTYRSIPPAIAYTLAENVHPQEYVDAFRFSKVGVRQSQTH